MGAQEQILSNLFHMFHSVAFLVNELFSHGNYFLVSGFIRVHSINFDRTDQFPVPLSLSWGANLPPVMNTIHSEIRTNYHSKNFTLILFLKERRRGALFS